MPNMCATLELEDIIMLADSLRTTEILNGYQKSVQTNKQNLLTRSHAGDVFEVLWPLRYCVNSYLDRLQTQCLPDCIGRKRWFNYIGITKSPLFLFHVIQRLGRRKEGLFF